MTVRQALATARKALTGSEIEDASLEAEVLMRHLLARDRAQIFLEPDRELTPEQDSAFRRLVARRLNDEPTAYIIGHREFYGLDFLVDPSVLVPRSETELLVERTLALARDCETMTIAEVGTGCGAIAVSLALGLPRAVIYAIDISPTALDVARTNCRRHGVTGRVRLIAGDMLDNLPQPVDTIVANLPYVREVDLPRTGLHGSEPRLALDGGVDGLDSIRRLCHQLDGKLRPGGHLLLEIGQGQAEAVTALLHGLFPSGQTEVAPDLSGVDRAVCLALP